MKNIYLFVSQHSLDMMGTSPMNSFMSSTPETHELDNGYAVSSFKNSSVIEKPIALLNEQMNTARNGFENEEDSNSMSSFRDTQNYDSQSNYLIALHRKFSRQETYFLSYHKTKPSLFGVPLLVPFTNDMKNRDLYSNVWLQVSKFLSPLPKASRDQSNHAEDCDDSMVRKKIKEL